MKLGQGYGRMLGACILAWKLSPFPPVGSMIPSPLLGWGSQGVTRDSCLAAQEIGGIWIKLLLTLASPSPLLGPSILSFQRLWGLCWAL